MRRFTCASCGHTFEVPYGTGTPGASMSCPQCGGSIIHRAADDRGYSRNARGASPVAQPVAGSQRGRGRHRGPAWAQAPADQP